MRSIGLYFQSPSCLLVLRCLVIFSLFTFFPRCVAGSFLLRCCILFLHLHCFVNDALLFRLLLCFSSRFTLFNSVSYISRSAFTCSWVLLTFVDALNISMFISRDSFRILLLVSLVPFSMSLIPGVLSRCSRTCAMRLSFLSLAGLAFSASSMAVSLLLSLYSRFNHLLHH